MLQGAEKAFQHIGYFERPLATSFYVGIVVMLFTVYYVLLTGTKKGSISSAMIWRVIFVVTALLVLSYPAAFSYDFFNYMFTAKTVLVYHQNPYVVTPLQFAGLDPWTNFMRWTHLTTAYTPLWIGLSLLPYVLGFGYFILVMFAMKCMVAGFYLLACWAITRVATSIDGKKQAHVLALFALNPLILIESLVSGHNDIVLVAFALLSVGMYVQKDMLKAWFFLACSIAAKFMTISMIPVYLFRRGRQYMLGAMFFGLLIVLVRREFLPWYWVWILPFVALNFEKVKLVRFAALVSFGLVLSYAPYTYFGEYSKVEQLWKTWIIWGSVFLGAFSFLLPTGGSSHRPRTY